MQVRKAVLIIILPEITTYRTLISLGKISFQYFLLFWCGIISFHNLHEYVERFTVMPIE